VTATQRRAALSPDLRLASLLHHLERHRRALDARSGLGQAELRLLWLLRDGEPRTLRRISEDLHLEQSTVNRQVNGAVQGGHLRRFREPGTTAYLFEPTRTGSAALERETATALGLYRDVLDRMGRTDAGQLLDLLGAFVDLYGAAVGDLDRVVPRT
jgi:DNA-binding MarR family transcriptional regulator